MACLESVMFPGTVSLKITGRHWRHDKKNSGKILLGMREQHAIGNIIMSNTQGEN